MSFNSVSNALFLPIVFFLYWFAKGKKYNFQNILLLLASYFYYACWDWRFLFLLVFSTVLDYFTGLKIYNTNNQKLKRCWLWLSISINVGLLVVFKYYNFFVESFIDIFSKSGIKANYWTLQIVLPIGISFYTFHGISYIVDICKNRIKAERNFVDYSLFVSFFPLLVAGPIERATHLLPQLKQNRDFQYSKVVDGLRQILWGLFKKIVIADHCAAYANMVFNDQANFSGSSHLLGAVFFAFQIYADFSGYSDIALGTARLFGIDLLRNFAYPYFSRDIAEYWRRWHISLSTWFRDYIYIPLGGSKVRTWIKVRNIFIIFLISGFWHGANWTFIVWGGLNALYIIPSFIFKTHRNNLGTVARGKLLPSIRESLSIVSTFGLTVFAWIFFRSKDLNHAASYINKICSKSLFTTPAGLPTVVITILLIFVFFTIEWLGREKQYAIEDLLLNRPKQHRWSFYYIILLFILFFGGPKESFIYFQF